MEEQTFIEKFKIIMGQDISCQQNPLEVLKRAEEIYKNLLTLYQDIREEEYFSEIELIDLKSKCDKGIAVTVDGIVYWIQDFSEILQSSPNQKIFLNFALRHLAKGEDVLLKIIRSEEEFSKAIRDLHPESCVEGGVNL